MTNQCFVYALKRNNEHAADIRIYKLPVLNAAPGAVVVRFPYDNMPTALVDGIDCANTYADAANLAINSVQRCLEYDFDKAKSMLLDICYRHFVPDATARHNATIRLHNTMIIGWDTIEHLLNGAVEDCKELPQSADANITNTD